MGKIGKALTGSLGWMIRNLYGFAFVLVIVSIVEAIHSLFSASPQDCMFWAWAIGFLGVSFFLFRMSLGRKSFRIIVMSVAEIMFVCSFCIESLRGRLIAPVLSGQALGSVMLVFIAINAIVIITGLRKCELVRKKRIALVILLCGALLCALLTFILPEWADVLLLDAATIYAILTFKKTRARTSSADTK